MRERARFGGPVPFPVYASKSMTVITYDTLKGTRASCPVCGTGGHACLGADGSPIVDPVDLPHDARPRPTGRMKRVRIHPAGGIPTEVWVPDAAATTTKKRDEGSDKKVDQPAPALTPKRERATGRPKPNIRTK